MAKVEITPTTLLPYRRGAKHSLGDKGAPSRDIAVASYGGERRETAKRGAAAPACPRFSSTARPSVAGTCSQAWSAPAASVPC